MVTQSTLLAYVGKQVFFKQKFQCRSKQMTGPDQNTDFTLLETISELQSSTSTMTYTSTVTNGIIILIPTITWHYFVWKYPEQ